MATSAERYVAAQNGAVRLAIRALEAFWKSADLSDPVGTARALEAFWVDLIATYGEVTATLAADRFEEATGMPATMVRPVDPERAAARARWAVGPLFNGDGDAWARLALLVDELVKQPGRSTMIRSARDHGIRFARVPAGSETCAFCLMLAGRGAVYATSSSAGQGRKFHGACDCQIEPVRDADDLERLRAQGYDPDDLNDKYLTARGKADSGSTKTILSELREQEGIH
jgi:hypothetical protein